MGKKVNWQGVFPALSTQFREDFSLDLDATCKTALALVDDGADGMVLIGTVGEGCSLEAAEKRKLLEAVTKTVDGRVPVLAGVAEYTTQMAMDLARDCKTIGLDGLMVMPPMVYPAQPHETLYHYEHVARAGSLPVMIYNNPPSYRTDVTPGMIAHLADMDEMAAVKDSSGDTRRLVDVRNAVGDRLILFCGLDDVVLESLALGATGWVSGMSNVFPKEAAHLFRLGMEGRYEEARPLYDWFMPLLHLDARTDLVQCIKLAEEVMGRGSSITRPPRLPLPDEERDAVIATVKAALHTRPDISTD